VTLPRIGVFDSGVGGLTVLKAMAEQLPAHYLYFGDTARLPYGTKSAETVARYAIGATRFLQEQDVDLLVIACNTATALAFPLIRDAARVPVVGVVEPGAAMAAEVSQSRSAIVIATEATVSSHAYRDALQRHGLSSYEKACPLFVPLVEEGWIEHPVTEAVARIYLGEALQQAPPEAPLLRRIVPNDMQIVDSAESTARAVKKIIDQHPTLSLKPGDKAGASEQPLDEKNRAVILSEVRLPLAAAERSRRTPIQLTPPAPADHRTFRFYVTDSTEKFKRLAARFLGRQVDHVEHVDLGG
jgi:glutamate racemase